MITKTITYENLDGEQVEQQLWFNLNRMELFDMLDMYDQVERLGKVLEGPKRDITMPEIMEILTVLKRLVRSSYGVRDGNRFQKSEEIWKDFEESPAYDAFMFGLFERPDEAVQFMVDVLPKNLPDMPDARGVTTSAGPDSIGASAPKTANDYSDEELLNMSEEDFTTLVGKDPARAGHRVLTIAFRRKVG